MLVSAVSYLNTWPLVWGLLYGPQKDIFDFRFDLPADCADALGAGKADIGLLPSAELDRLALGFLPDVGIACEGPVRTILLISKVPPAKIETVALDASSRTSVALTRILLRQVYGTNPRTVSRPPDLENMLAECDAALIIGDPALRLDPRTLPYLVLDLGAEWVNWTGLPMVFAVWSGRREVLTQRVAQAFRDSWEWGRNRIDEMAERAWAERGFDQALAREYLSRHIAYELTSKHLEGLALFRKLVRELKPADAHDLTTFTAAVVTNI